MKLAGLLVVLVVLAASAAFYSLERSMEHFLWHVGYGAAAGILGAAVLRASAVKGGLLGYGYMVIPDLIWLAGKWGTGTPYPHQPWMDVFLFHISLDTWAWATPLVLPTYLAAIGIYGVRAGRVMKRASVAAS